MSVQRRQLSEETRNFVRERAVYLCEYCHTAEQWQYVPFTIDHVIPISLGGTNSVDNLALACFHCNRRKSNRDAAIDSESGQHASLFNPRRERWANHFPWSADSLVVVGLTSTGRATIAQLHMNRERVQNIRAADAAVNRHPPATDPILS